MVVWYAKELRLTFLVKSNFFGKFESWNGVLKLCCCSSVCKMIWDLSPGMYLTNNPWESPKLEIFKVLFCSEHNRAVLEPTSITFLWLSFITCLGSILTNLGLFFSLLVESLLGEISFAFQDLRLLESRWKEDLVRFKGWLLNFTPNAFAMSSWSLWSRLLQVWSESELLSDWLSFTILFLDLDSSYLLLPRTRVNVWVCEYSST